MQGGSPGYAIYDAKTNLLSFFEWAETIKRLKAAYEVEEDAIYDIANILAPNNLEEFIDGTRKLEHKTWFRPDAAGKKIANFENAYLQCSMLRKKTHEIPGILSPLKSIAFGDNYDVILVRVDKNIEVGESKLFAQQYDNSGSAKLIKQEGEGGGKTSDYPIMTPEQTKQILLFESQQKEDDKSIFSFTKMIKTAFFSPAAANSDDEGTEYDSELDDL
jgi:hypothetical protein